MPSATPLFDFGAEVDKLGRLLEGSRLRVTRAALEVHARYIFEEGECVRCVADSISESGVLVVLNMDGAERAFEPRELESVHRRERPTGPELTDGQRAVFEESPECWFAPPDLPASIAHRAYLCRLLHEKAALERRLAPGVETVGDINATPENEVYQYRKREGVTI